LLAFPYVLANKFLLVMPGIISRMAANGDARAARVLKIPMTALAASIDKSCFLQGGNQLANLARHFSIISVSNFSALVKGMLSFELKNSFWQLSGMQSGFEVSQLECRCVNLRQAGVSVNLLA